MKLSKFGCELKCMVKLICFSLGKLAILSSYENQTKQNKRILLILVTVYKQTVFYSLVAYNQSCWLAVRFTDVLEHDTGEGSFQWRMCIFIYTTFMGI